jgi:hypothetical protein
MEPSPVTLIYADPTALMLAPSEVGGGTEDVVAPGATAAISRLVDGGFEVVVLGPPMDAGGTVPDGVRFAPELPEHLEADDWYLTAEPHPAFGRPRGGTTVLIGPHRPEGKLPLPRFDVEARDLASAVMEILTREAMA